MFFISGITGQVGGAAARHLLEHGHKVRTLSRDPQKASNWAAQGVEVRQGDLNDSTALASALEEVEGAFLMQPPVFIPAPGYPMARANIASFTEALKQTPPPRLAVLSSVGSEQGSGLGNITATHLLEESLQNAPFPVAFVRAGAFIENNLPALKGAAATGIFHSFLAPTDRAVPMAATRDIGIEIARLLMSGWDGQKIVELGSRISPDELASAMSEVLGRPVVAQAIPRAMWGKSLEAFGVAPGTSAPYEEMQNGFNSGWIDFGRPNAEPVAGTTTPAQVFAGAKAAH